MAPNNKNAGEKSKKSSDPVVEISVPEGLSSFMTPIAILVSAILVAGAVIYAGSKVGNVTTDTDVAGAETNTTDTDQETTPTDTTNATLTTVRQFETFTEYDYDICKEDGKPVVYLFSTTWCPHCEYIHDTFDQWAKDNTDKIVAYHWEVDTYDNTLTDAVETAVPEDADAIYKLFNPNESIPTFVFGCRYGRVGNGFESTNDLAKETAAFDSVVDELLK